MSPAIAGSGDYLGQECCRNCPQLVRAIEGGAYVPSAKAPGPGEIEGIISEGEKRMKFAQTHKGLVVNGEEQLASIVQGDSTIKLRDYVLNPGNHELWPKLNGIAKNYQKYMLTDVCFVLKSLIGADLDTQGVGELGFLEDDNTFRSDPTDRDWETQNIHPLTYTSDNS